MLLPNVCSLTCNLRRARRVTEASSVPEVFDADIHVAFRLEERDARMHSIHRAPPRSDNRPAQYLASAQIRMCCTKLRRTQLTRVASRVGPRELTLNQLVNRPRSVQHNATVRDPSRRQVAAGRSRAVSNPSAFGNSLPGPLHLVILSRRVAVRLDAAVTSACRVSTCFVVLSMR